MKTSSGVYTNAVYGFLKTLFKILKEQKPRYLAVTWDLTRDTFRRSLYPLYKANRGDTPLPLIDQFNLMPEILKRKILSDREIEVMSLIVQGLINKEIADKLNIGLATVITHRKNIMDKLGMKSVSALTIYAVMHGYVDINKI